MELPRYMREKGYGEVNDIPERVRGEVWKDADYRGCSLVHPENGICARGAGRAEMHHITYRSAGGSDDPSNLLTVCSHHHHLIHAGKIKAVGDGKTLVFVEGETEWQAWPNVKEAYEWEAEMRKSLFEEHISRAGCELLNGCRELGHLVSKNLLWIHDCGNLEEFAAMTGVSKVTMWQWANVGRFLIDLTDDEFETLVKLPYWRVRDSLAGLRSLTSPDRPLALQALVEAHEAGETPRQFRQTVEELDSPVGELELYDVAVRVEGTAHWRVRASDVKDAIGKAKTRTLGYRPFMPLTEGDPPSVELGVAHAERVERDDVD